MNSENKKLVIFDFDGVLADTEEFCYKIYKDVNGNLTWEKFREFSEGNFHVGMTKAVQEGSHIIPLDFYNLYRENLSVINIHDILKETILKLKDKYRLAIISSTDGVYISSFLEKEKVLNYFDDILGHEVHASKVIKINILLEKYNTKNTDVIFITDSLGDVLEANECKVRSIGVTWGLHDRGTLSKGSPAIVIDEPGDLLKVILDMLK